MATGLLLLAFESASGQTGTSAMRDAGGPTVYGIANGRLTTAGFGASRPKASNETLEGRVQNRRVDLVRLAEDASLTEDGHFVFFGVATIDEDGRICLQLRTEEPGQPVAEGYFCYDESRPDHAKIRDHVGPIEVGKQKVIEPFGDRK